MTDLRLRNKAFDCLVRQAKACTICPRMEQSQRVVGHASGRIEAPVLFIGEAPGRLGADASAIPFHGDKAGDNFEDLIEQAGLSRYDCFITNAVLCNPKDADGNNATPTNTEIESCARFLKTQIEIVDPRIIVTLGAKALLALKSIETHNIELASGIRKKWDWCGRVLVPLYHPGQRAMIHRSFLNQLADYRFVAETLRSVTASRPRVTNTKPTAPSVAAIVQELLSLCGPISYFALHKLFYLLEYEHCRQTSERMTRCYIIRQKDGPYVVELNIRRLKKALPELRVWNEGNKLMLSLKESDTLFSSALRTAFVGDRRVDETIKSVASRYAHRSDEELKRVVYLTTPMRRILRREKYRRENQFNVPVDFSGA